MDALPTWTTWLFLLVFARCGHQTDHDLFSPNRATTLSPDTERPMKIELILDPTNQPLVNRVAPAAQGKAATKSAGGAGGATSAAAG